jgi:CheY-like chemotaxis protein
MDMQIPHMNGLDATVAIRALSACQETPILAITANAFDEDRRVCLDAGMNDHIAKPVDPQKLYETLLSWMEKRDESLSITSAISCHRRTAGV